MPLRQLAGKLLFFFGSLTAFLAPKLCAAVVAIPTGSPRPATARLLPKGPQMCRGQQGAVESAVNGFRIRLIPGLTEEGDGCKAEVDSAQGRIVFSTSDWGLTLLDVTGKDVNGDGDPGAVVEGYSGGAHCCWTYWIVSLGKSPGLLRRICNFTRAQFEDLNGDGRIEIVTRDGAFDYFEASHAYSAFPLVILRLDGKELNRVDQEFWPLYEKEIAEARAKLSPAMVEWFRKDAPDDAYSKEGTKYVVLTIVLDELYGGREQQAWKSLEELWPEKDLSRIRDKIRKTAAAGFLKDPHSANFGCLE